MQNWRVKFANIKIEASNLNEILCPESNKSLINKPKNPEAVKLKFHYLPCFERKMFLRKCIAFHLNLSQSYK